MVITHECVITFANPLARRWIREFFPRARQAGRLPDRVCRWLGAEEQERGKRLLERRGRRYLLVRRHRPSADDTFVLLLELATARAAISRGSGKLTPRENEVLVWIDADKSDPEIAIIVGCGVRTVHKHVQRILLKLGVENRTAAASYLRVMQTNHIARLGRDASSAAGSIDRRNTVDPQSHRPPNAAAASV